MDAGRLSDLLVQQPYTPVCLMTEIVCGTSLEGSLDFFRRLRDEVLLGRLGLLGKFSVGLYYRSSRVLAPIARKTPSLRRILLGPYRLLYRAALKVAE